MSTLPNGHSKQKAVKLPPQVLQAVEDVRAALPGRVNFSDVLRMALDLWLGEAPQALNADELRVLKAVREARRRGESTHAALLHDLASACERLGLTSMSNLSHQRAVGAAQAGTDAVH